MLAGAALFAQLGTTALLSLDARGATDGLRLFNVLGLACLLFALCTGAASTGCATAPTAAALRLSGTAVGAGAGVLAAIFGGIGSALIVVACGVVCREVLLRCIYSRCECPCLVLLRGHEDRRKVIVVGVFLGLGARDDVRGVVVILEIFTGFSQHLVQLRCINRSGIKRASRCFVRLIRGFCRFGFRRFRVLRPLGRCASFGCGLGKRCLYLVFDLGNLIVHVLAHAVAQVFFIFRGLLPLPWLGGIGRLFGFHGSGLTGGLAGALGALLSRLLFLILVRVLFRLCGGLALGLFSRCLSGSFGGGCGGVGNRGGVRYGIQHLACFLAGKGALRALFQAHVFELCHQLARGKPQLLGQGIHAGLVL